MRRSKPGAAPHKLKFPLGFFRIIFLSPRHVRFGVWALKGYVEAPVNPWGLDGGLHHNKKSAPLGLRLAGRELPPLEVCVVFERGR